MIKADIYYKEYLQDIVDSKIKDKNPRPKYESDGVPAHTYFITQTTEKYNITKGEFPITTLRNTATKMGIQEMLTIYQDQVHTNDAFLKRGIKWWTPWSDKDGNLGQRYGATIRKYDLMNKLLNGLENDPFGRRHIINLFQYEDFEETEGLIPCAFETLWSVREIDNITYLDLTLNQRSNDYIMAGYINKIQYVAFQMMVACHLRFEVGNFKHDVQNLHIYDRHLNASDEILNREPLDFQPSIELNCKKGTNFYDIRFEDFKINTSKDIKKLSSVLEIAI